MKKGISILCFGALAGWAKSQPADTTLVFYNNAPEIVALRSITLKNGFHIQSGKNVRIFIQGFPNLTSTPTATQNYILTRRFRKEVKESELGQMRTIAEENQTVQYFDGLGRLVQTVELMASPTYKDIVQHIEYDGFGRESVKYLPYAEQTSADGSYKTTAKTSQANYYRVGGGWDAGVVKTPTPYAVTVFENSPLNRVTEQGAPGEAWQPVAGRNNVTRSSAGGHTVAMEYGTNAADEVPLWTVTAAGATGTGSYAAGRLYKTVTRDENWVNGEGKGGTVEEFRDFEDRVVMKRVWESNTRSLSTHYVYDDFGDLRYVIPPGYTARTVTDNNVDFNELVYAYRYDGRRRLVEKKVPGKGWEWIVYNRNDLPIMTQDAVQRARTPQEWSYTKYDAFGRVVQTGVLTASYATQLAAQTAADNHARPGNRDWEQRRVNVAEYSNVSFPVAGLKRLTVNYYDNYSRFMGTVDTVQLAPRAVSRSLRVHSLLTGSRVYTDSGTDSLLTVYYYDDRGRIIQTASRNHLGGKDIITNTYLFSGEVETSRHEHWAGLTTQPSATILTTNIYDHVGRLVETKKKVNSQPEVIQSRLSYNGIGQLTEKKLHSENSGTSFLTTVGYQYNERGWQSRAGSPQFTYQLNYHKNGNTVLSNAQYNGNIAQQLWGHAATTNSTFAYSYDRLNRLTNGTSSGATVMIEALTYDDMGNIRTLRRDNGTVITYNYNNSQKSNRLASLSGGLSGSFTYDLNGNATKDRTGMNFAYNHLNLPRTVSKAAAGTAPAVTVNYLYDALGTKLRRTATVGTTTTQQDYIGSIEYRKTGTAAGVIERISTEEGYLQNSGGTYAYHYNLTDHLGNVRVVLKRGTSATAPEVVQRQDYYPFGKTRAIVTGGINRYLYNGKEMQADLNGGTHALGSSYVLEGQLDYGARFYDAEIGRWNVVDPLAEQMRRHSPYNYAFDNPVRFIDPDGMAPRAGQHGMYYDYDEGRYRDEDGNDVSLDQAMAYHQQGGGQDDPTKKGQESSSQGDLPYLSDLHKRAKNFSYDAAWGLLKEGELWEYFKYVNDNTVPVFTPGISNVVKFSFTINVGKFSYFFGKVVTGPAHNVTRSAQNLKDLTALGIKNETELMMLFEKAIRTGTTVSTKTSKYGTTVMRSVEVGGKGEIMVGFFYEAGKMGAKPSVSTIIPKVFK